MAVRRRRVIVARIKPGAWERVAETFAEPYDPVTSRPPKDAMAVEFSRWNA